MTDPLVDRVAALNDARRYGDAARAARQALTAEPHQPVLLCELARAELGAGEPAGAIAAADLAIAGMPDHEWPWRIKAYAHMDLRQWDAATAAARQAVELAPHSPECQLAFAEVMVGRGQYRRAIGIAEALIADNPGWAKPHGVVGRAQLGQLRWRQAETTLRRALELDPASPQLQSLLAEALLRGGRRHEASELFLAAGAADPTTHQNRSGLWRSSVPVPSVWKLVLVAVALVWAIGVVNLLPEPANLVALLAFVVAVVAAGVAWVRRDLRRHDQRVRTTLRSDGAMTLARTRRRVRSFGGRRR